MFVLTNNENKRAIPSNELPLKIRNGIMRQRKIFKTQNTRITENFYDSISTVIRISQITGCAPFRFSKHGIRKTILNYFCVIIQIVAYIVLLVRYVSTELKREDFTNEGSIFAASCFAVLTFWIESVFRIDNWYTLLKKLIAIDQGLLKFNVWVAYEVYVKKLRWILAGVVVQMFLPLILHLYTPEPNYIKIFVTMCLPHWTSIALCYAVSEMVFLIKERLNLLNDLLSGLTNRNLNEVSTVEGKKQEKPLAILCHVCTWHHDIIKLMRLINETFGFRMVALFGYSFVILVFGIFMICQQFKEDMDWFELLHLISTTTCYGYMVYRICNACEYTVKEAEKSGLLIHQIETADFDMRDEIEMFSLQIANEHMEFNAAGFFPINYSLLFSIIGGVTTYIIILIQLASSSTTTSMDNATTTDINNILSETYGTTLY